jgi:hypoxanthine phosphoribosyltransferase
VIIFSYYKGGYNTRAIADRIDTAWLKVYNFTMNSPVLQVLVPRKKIEDAVTRLAGEITRDYQDKNPVLLGVLKGSFMFMADLVRQLDFSLEIEFVRCSSYDSGRYTTGKVKLAPGLDPDIKGRHVLLVEDIVDTGVTLAFLKDYLEKKKPASLKLCTLADKPSRRVAPLALDYTGLIVPDKFVVGYGMDDGEKYRNLPDIYYLED